MWDARRLPAALLAVLALALAAGCGGDDADVAAGNAYVEQLNAAQREFAASIERIDGRVSERSTPRQDRRTLRSFTQAADEVAAKVASIRPPESVGRLHAGLVEDFETYAEEVRTATGSLTSGDADRVMAAQERLLEATDTVTSEINRAIDDINAKLRSS